MKIIKQRIISEAMDKYADARTRLQSWLAEAKAAEWNCFQDVKKQYPTASFVGKRAIFNIRGNNYRLVVQIAFNVKVVSIEWFGTHADYSKKNW